MSIIASNPKQPVIIPFRDLHYDCNHPDYLDDLCGAVFSNFTKDLQMIVNFKVKNLDDLKPTLISLEDNSNLDYHLLFQLSIDKTLFENIPKSNIDQLVILMRMFNDNIRMLKILGYDFNKNEARTKVVAYDTEHKKEIRQTFIQTKLDVIKEIRLKAWQAYNKCSNQDSWDVAEVEKFHFDVLTHNFDSAASIFACSPSYYYDTSMNIINAALYAENLDDLTIKFLLDIYCYDDSVKDLVHVLSSCIGKKNWDLASIMLDHINIDFEAKKNLFSPSGSRRATFQRIYQQAQATKCPEEILKKFIDMELQYNLWIKSQRFPKDDFQCSIQ